MRDIIEGPPEEGEDRPPLGRRVMWFVLLALGGTTATAMVAYGLRAMLKL
jgi:hypothetical protein